jgi:hypothetical protein
MTDDVLQSLDVQRRESEKQKLKELQNKRMENRLVQRETNNFNQSVNASNDQYMKDALSKVRQSEVTHSETLTRFNGTWMHNQKMKN